MASLHRHLALALALAASVATTAAWTRRSATAAETNAAAPPIHVSAADHVYRVVGRVNLLLFSLSDNDVGGARLAWRRREGTAKISLLVGSEPSSAPRELNEWAYSFEEVAPDRADGFLVGSMTLAEPPEPKPQDVPRGAREYRVVCSSINTSSAQSLMTKVRTDKGITYHAVARVFDHLGTPRWQALKEPVPPDASPGLLTALGRVLGGDLDLEQNGGKGAISVPYIYNSAVYDLKLRKARRQHDVAVGNHVYPELLRADFVAIRRRDKDPTPFTVNYALKGPYAGVPVGISFRPSWWLTVELQLEDRYRVPADPGDDPAVAGRIRDICAAASASRE